MTEASEIWHSSDSDVKSLKKELAREKREKRKLQASSDQQITELTETIEILGKQQSDHKAKYQELCAARENAKIFKKDLNSKEKEIERLKRTVSKVSKEAEKLPKLLENLKKLATRKKELIQERNFQEKRKQFYLNENRLLKAQARENQFKVYDCKYHSCTTESTANENFLNFKNQFFK